MNRSKRIAKTLSMVTFAEVISRLYPFILLHIIIKRLGVEYFGAANYAIAIIDILAPIVSLGFSFAAALAIKATDNKQKHNDIFSSVFWSRLTIAAILCIALQIVLALGLFDSQQHKFLIQIASVAIIFTAFDSDYVFALKQSYSKYSLIIIAAKTLIFFLTLWLVQTSEDTFIYVLLFQLNNGLLCVGSFIYSLKFFKLSLPSWPTAKALIVGAGWISLSNVMFFIIDRVEFVIAEAAFSGLAASGYIIGLYAGPYRIVQSAAPFAGMISKVFYSETLSNPNREQLTRIMNYQYLIINALLVGAGVFSLFYASPILNILLGPEYVNTDLLLTLLLISAALGSSAVNYVYQIMWTYGSARQSSFLQIAICLMVIFLGYWSGKTWGINGFATTILIIKGCYFLLALSFSRKHVIRAPLKELFVVLNSCLVLATVAYLTRTLTWYYSGILAGLAYIAALMLFAKPLLKETLAALKEKPAKG